MALYLNSTLFKNAFSTPEMRYIFDEDSFMEKFLQVEAALARAEADAGLIPEEAAIEITEKADLEFLDIDVVSELVAKTGHVAMATIGGWKPAFDGNGEYIHWGATTQDIIDTTVVLQVREALDVVRDTVTSIRDELAALADEYRDTPMIGRTHYVHAIPITFGLKVAVWVDELTRHLDRLDEVESRMLSLEFFGATGTLASLGEPGLEVQENLADELDLSVPNIVWQPSRDRFAELLGALAMIGSTLSKVARQVLFMHRPEVHEAQELVSEGHIGSSTMPHKRNPKRSETTVMLARLVREQSRLMNEVMETIDERDASTWYAEFAVIPNAFLYMSRLLENISDLLDNFEVYPEQMEENMDIHGDLVVSERIMMALAEEIGRQSAHDVVAENAWEALDSGRSFGSVLREDDRVTDALSESELEELLDASTYTGMSGTFVDRVLDQSS